MVVKKMDQKGILHELSGVFIYVGIGLRCELEIYIMALEELKSRIVKLQMLKESIDGLVTRGVKKDLACTTFLTRDLSLDIAFTKSSAQPTKFTFKSTFMVETEPLPHIVMQ